jgi:hypothetical protein
MIQLIAKSKHQLSSIEKQQLENIIRRYYKGAKPAFLEYRLNTGPEFDIILQKKEDEVLAASYYHHSKGDSPFCQNIHLVQFGVAVKKEGHKGNVIWQNGKFYARKRLGPLWLMKKGIGISAICNPKVLENFTRLFKFNYPYSTKQQSAKVIEFLDKYFDGRGINIKLDNDFCFNDDSLEKTDITSEYDKFYRSRNTTINQLFFELGILLKENEKIYLTGKHIVACGYRNPFDWRKKIRNP